MLGIEFAMLKIDLLVSNLLPFSFAIFMWVSLLGIDMFWIPLREEISWVAIPLDSYNAMINLVGSPPLMVNETILTLEHVMQRLDIIENKVATIELIENLDKKIHNHITQYGSKVGDYFKKSKGERTHS